MRFLLRIKHWQLFLLSWGAPIIMNLFTITNPNLLFKLFPVMMLFFILGIFGWIWAIATELHGKLPPHVKLNVGRFKILFSIPILYMLAIVMYMGYAIGTSSSTAVDSTTGVIVGFVIVLHLLSIVCIIIGLRFAAKTMKSVELGRMARFGDYVGEFFLMWFSIIGFWVLQPRLNQLSKD